MSARIVCTDVDIPRVDGKGTVTGLTIGKEYTTIQRDEYRGKADRHFYRIINDDGRAANYLKIRFKLVK